MAIILTTGITAGHVRKGREGGSLPDGEEAAD